MAHGSLEFLVFPGLVFPELHVLVLAERQLQKPLGKRGDPPGCEQLSGLARTTGYTEK